MRFKKNDGGRAKAGYKGTTGDCVTRAIAIATGKPYQEVYDEMFSRMKEFGENSYSRKAKRAAKVSTPRRGIYREVYQPYLEELGWEWVPTMEIGSGCKVHLNANELPKGTIITRLSKHVACVKDGVLHDTYDCSRDGTRCVYGYFIKK